MSLLFRRLVLSARHQAAFAQVAVATVHSYDFLTIMIIKAAYKTDCRMLLTPTFQGKTDV
jgi:hypothetical protein